VIEKKSTKKSGGEQTRRKFKGLPKIRNVENPHLRRSDAQMTVLYVPSLHPKKMKAPKVDIQHSRRLEKETKGKGSVANG